MFNHHHHHRGADACHGPHRGFGGRSHGGRHGWRGGERSERVFDQGDLRLVILALLAEQPSHGYELIKAIETRLGGAYVPSPGVVYPTLTLLEEMGFATVEAQDGGKKLYTLTDAGRADLEENRRAVDALFARMDETRARSSRESPQIRRAMENLFTALKYRLAEGPLSEAEAQAIAAALDQAAVAVERKA